MSEPNVPEEGDALQNRSRDWWGANPMSYDWQRTMMAEEGSPEFFQEVDARFLGSSPFYSGQPPFSRLIPLDQLKGKRVLEIGCGLGAHAELLAEAGCDLTAIDLTQRAVETTRLRFEQRGLAGDIRQMDAEHLEFEDSTFDFVWSWGVIHHSSRPRDILAEVARVLKPGGEFRLMVYFKRSLSGYYAVARGFVTGKTFKGMSNADIRSHYTDGYIARFYTRAELSGLLNNVGLVHVRTRVLGQTAELYPLPGRGSLGGAKRRLIAATPDSATEFVLSRAGYFLMGSGIKPADLG